MNAYFILMLIAVIGFSVVQAPYGYSLNNNSSVYYQKDCTNDTCVVTTCNDGQPCQTDRSENSTANNTQSQLTDKGILEPQTLEFENFWENFLNFNN
jgi:hypothetical protein